MIFRSISSVSNSGLANVKKLAIGNFQVPRKNLGMSIFIFHSIFLHFFKSSQKEVFKESQSFMKFPFKYQNVAIDLDTFLQFLARFLESLRAKLYEIFEIAFGLLRKCEKLEIFQIC